MKEGKGAPGVWASVWEFLASVRLTVILLLSLAATSIVGTVIPQNESPMAYLEAYGEFLFRLFSVFDFFDMYRSWWFQLLIILLAVNIIVCSIDRLSSVGRIIFTRNPRFKRSRFLKVKSRETFGCKASPEELKTRFEPVLSGAFSKTVTEETEEGFSLFAEKWRWTRLGVYVVHSSIVILLAGALVGSIFGFDGFVTIPEQSQTRHIHLRSSNEGMELPFEIRCEDFDVSFYETGAPKEFRSTLTLIEDGQAVLTRDIIVNDPLVYKGIRIYQSSYGKLPPDMGGSGGPNPEVFEFRITEVGTGKSAAVEVKPGETVDLPDGWGKLSIADYDPDFHFGGRELGPAVSVKLERPGKEATMVLLPLRFPNFDRMRGGELFITVSGNLQAAALEDRYYTGLQVSRDPGVPLVYAGFIFMLLGFIVTFFMSHQTLCVDIRAKGAGAEVTVSGIANRNRLGMENKTRRLAERLKALA
ncbi:MAG: cytochrome c biogenesis protein ResB [Desulfobacterales bacterium]